MIKSICTIASGGAGGGEGVLFLRAPSVKQVPETKKKCKNKFSFNI